MSQSNFYVTTPIYYVTDKPHIGHLYTTVAADIQARYHRLLGDNVWFLTGTDEHGQKIQKKAKESGETPAQLADRVVERYKEAWKRFDITHDDFIRTTESRHKQVVTDYIARLMKTGDIYLSSYEGWYCVPDETYWTETQIVEGKCPECGRPVERLKEESYFFKMSAFEGRLKEHILKNPSFIQPDSRRNEILGFIEQGLKDISVSRTTIEWGIDMPKDGKATKEHKVYVWFDALTNYLSALGGETTEAYKTFWPNAVHLVGKDIIRFHCVYWPTFLMALGLPLPKQIIAHGWLTDSNRKIGKSLGNAIDPIALAEKVGVDGMRFFLFREFIFGQDGEYTEEILYRRINSDLANDYGNCVSRTCSMALKYLGEAPLDFGKVLGAQPKYESPFDLHQIVTDATAEYHAAMQTFAYHKALESLWKVLSKINTSIDLIGPWKLAKSGETADQEKLKLCLVNWLEALRIISILLLPFIPETAPKALAYLGQGPVANLLTDGGWGTGPTQRNIGKVTPLFPRLEYKPAEEA